MSTLINLLPDLRQAKLRALHRRQLVTGIAVGIWMTCGGIIVLMLIIWTGQKVSIAAATSSIKDKTSQLKGMEGLDDAYAAEQQLAVLPGLYDQRVYMTQFFKAVESASPINMTISTLNVDATNTMTVHGTASAYSEVAKVARALAKSNILVGENAAPDNEPYFTNVNISEASSDKTGVSFTLSALVAAGVTHGK